MIAIRHPDYPILALQELARNAVIHGTYEGTNAPIKIFWYADRIEIMSPGGPFGQVNIENFGKPNVVDYRNPAIAEACATHRKSRGDHCSVTRFISHICRKTVIPTFPPAAARIEEEVVVTDRGCRVISLFPAEELPFANRY